MAKVWDKIKGSVRTGAKVVKDGSESVARKVAEEAPGVAKKVATKTKQFASVVADKTEDAYKFSKLKIKIHQLNGDVDKTMSELGGHTFELIQKNRTDIHTDKKVQTLIEKVKTLKNLIQLTEKEIAALKEDDKKTGV